MVAATPPGIMLLSRNNSIFYWHLELSNAPLAQVKQIAAMNIFPVLSQINFKKSTQIICSGCAHGKQCSIPHSPAHRSHVPPGHTLPSDTMVPFTAPSLVLHRYILTTIDMATGYSIPSPLRTKTEVEPMISQTIISIHNRLQSPIHRFHSDNAKELLTNNQTVILCPNGIRQTTTIPQHPAHNALCERWNHTILNAAR